MLLENSELFDCQVDNYRLKKVYDVTVAGSKYQNLDFNSLTKGSLRLLLEEDNKYDDKAVAVYKDEIKLGYMFKDTALRDYVRLALTTDQYIYKAYLYYINPDNKELRYKLAMYKMLSRDNHHCVKEYTFKLRQTHKDDRSNALWCMCEKTMITLERDLYDDQIIVVYSEHLDEIGELSSKDSETVLEWFDKEEYELYCYADELEINGLDEVNHGTIKVFVYTPESLEPSYYPDYKYDYEDDEEDYEDEDTEELYESGKEEPVINDSEPVFKYIKSIFDNNKTDNYDKERNRKLNKLKRDYGHAFDYIDKDLNADLNAIDNEFGSAIEEYDDLLELESKLNKIKREDRRHKK